MVSVCCGVCVCAVVCCGVCAVVCGVCSVCSVCVQCVCLLYVCVVCVWVYVCVWCVYSHRTMVYFVLRSYTLWKYSILWSCDNSTHVHVVSEIYREWIVSCTCTSYSVQLCLILYACTVYWMMGSKTTIYMYMYK